MSNYISLQGKVYLALIVAGVVGVRRFVGNVPSLEIEIDGTTIDHQESSSGQRTTDLTITTVKKVGFKGELEEVDKANMAYLLNGLQSALPETPVVAQNLGTVTTGVEIALGAYSVSSVVIKDSTGTPVVVEASKYTLDADYGTLVFNDVTGLTMPLKADYTPGSASVTTINDSSDKEYELTFRGVNTVDQSKIELKLWRTRKDPKTTFPLIHDKLGSYNISGSALSDAEKGKDGTLGLFGRVVTIGASA